MKKAIIIVFSIFLISCEEGIILDVNQVEQKVVIEGLITNRPGQQYVKIGKTADFYSSGLNPAVSSAIVSVSDNLGNTYTFSESTEKSGLYIPNVSFTAEVGRTYSLDIDIDGEKYTASEELLGVANIDSLTYGMDEEEFSDPEDEGRFYNVFVYTKEPQDEDNFYLFKFYRNDEWLNDSGEDITVTDDVAIGEAIEGLELPEYHSVGDSVSMEMYSLTQTEFIYWSDVANLIFSDGGVFSPLPANPRSNISGGALGIFQVSAVSSSYVVIK